MQARICVHIASITQPKRKSFHLLVNYRPTTAACGVCQPITDRHHPFPGSSYGCTHLTFDVTVDDLILVEVGQTSEQLLCVVDYHTFLKGTVLVQQMRDRATWNKTDRGMQFIVASSKEPKGLAD